MLTVWTGSNGCNLTSSLNFFGLKCGLLQHKEIYLAKHLLILTKNWLCFKIDALRLPLLHTIFFDLTILDTPIFRWIHFGRMSFSISRSPLIFSPLQLYHPMLVCHRDPLLWKYYCVPAILG